MTISGKAWGIAAASAAAILVASTCRSTKTTGANPPSSPSPTPVHRTSPTPLPAAAPRAATPSSADELPPGATPLPVRTPSSGSTYDREPGVLYEESRPAPPTPAAATPRPPRRTPTRTPTTPPSGLSS